MTTLPGRLGILTAHDVMTGQVVCVCEIDPIDTAIGVLRENHITGAPVVDEQGKLVGILSLNDLISAPHDGPSDESPATPLAHGTDRTIWDLFERAGRVEADTSEQKVGDRMSRQVTSVTENAPLVDIARAMCDGHWHRVPVVDNAGSLTGIISTMDVLAAMVNAHDEMQ
jgi:CBS domain-containing protein